MSKSTSPCDSCRCKSKYGNYFTESLTQTEESRDDYCNVYRCLLMHIGDKCKSLNKYRKKHNS